MLICPKNSTTLTKYCVFWHFDMLCLQGMEWKCCILWGNNRSKQVGCNMGSTMGDKDKH